MTFLPTRRHLPTGSLPEGVSRGVRGGLLAVTVALATCVPVASGAASASKLVDPDTARRLAEEELTKDRYHPFNLLQWILDLLFLRSQNAFSAADLISTKLWAGVGATAVVVIMALVAWSMWRRRRAPITPTAHSDSLQDLQLSSRQYLQMAADLRERSADEAVKAAFFSIVAQLEHSGVILPSRGRTAGEVHRVLVGRYPDLAARISQASRLFDLAAYGDSNQQRCGSHDVDLVLELSEAVRQRLRPQPGAVSVAAASGPGLNVGGGR